jgi:hypothetical protein
MRELRFEELEAEREALEAEAEELEVEEETEYLEEPEELEVEEEIEYEPEPLEVEEMEPLRTVWPGARADLSRTGFGADPLGSQRVINARRDPLAKQPAEALTGEVTGLVEELCAEVVSLREVLRALRDEIHRGGFADQL